MSDKIVTVVGATGSLGLKIVKALLDQGALVRAMVRTTSNRSALEALGVKDFVVADLMDKASLKEALMTNPRSDAIIASAAGYTGHTAGDSSLTDREGYKNLVDAVKDAGIARFILISVLECDKATSVPHFYNKHLVEKYLQEKEQPYISMRAGGFIDQSKDIVHEGIKKGYFPEFFPGITLGMVYSKDLARYSAEAALRLPVDRLNTIVDIGWSTPANGALLAASFSKILGRPIEPKPAFPSFAVNVIMPFLGIFKENIRDMVSMIRWVKKGMYTSKNPQLQKELFGELPSIDEAVLRYCQDKKLI